MECQKMFLRLFFRTRVEVHDAIVYSLRDNGFLAYVPVFDYKGPVYLQNRQEIVCMDPTLLSPTPSALGADEGTNTDPNMFDKRGKELPGYECVLTGERSDSNEAQELLISPKKQGGTKGLGPVLRILPLQRVRVAMTSAPWSGTSGACAIRLVLVSASSSGKAADASKAKKNDVTEDVIQAEEKNKLSLVSNRLQVVTKSRKEMREESLYTALKAALCSQPNGISGSRTGHNNRQAACANRYEILPGRVAFGPQEGVRSIFILTRNKAIEMEKAKERRQEDSAEKSEGQELQKRTNTSTQKKKNFSSYSGTSKELETELLMESLKDGKTAAMLKMQQWGEEWAEEEELPTSWEAGEGGGADTELGKKAASGGFTKELYLATARQSKLKVAKKNSKYG